jgi:hypothetical protein
MKLFFKINILFITLVMLVPAAPAKQSREQEQARLDAACETAREIKLKPLREKFVDECVVNKELPSREECTRFYADYGGRMGNRAPLFYDLPECVAAFDYQQGARSPD